MKKGGSRFTAASLTYTDKHNVPAALPELSLQDAHKCLQPGLVRLREAADAGAVDVQDADDLGACVNGTTISELDAQSQAIWPGNR